MGCKIDPSSLPILFKIPSSRKPTTHFSFSFHPKHKTISVTSCSQTSAEETQLQEAGPCSVRFQTLRSCKLGISRYPDFDYNGEGGRGSGSGKRKKRDISASFDVQSLYIPPLSSATTRFLGLPLPPFLKIQIVPELLEGTIDEETGQVDFEFRAKFWFSIGAIYRAPPLVVKTVLTSEEAEGVMKRGQGERRDREGNCRLVGIATVEPISDIFMNSFLGLPTECLAELNANIAITGST